MSEMNNSNSQLQAKLEAMEINFSQLQDEMKKLKNKTEEICCPDGWITFQCSCYFKSTYWKTWSESRKDCQEKGADLVIINSKEEQEFVSKLSSYFWIGLEGTGRGWKWLDGSPLTVTFWEDGKQNSYSSYRVYNNYEGKWNPTYDNVSANWICEKNSSISQ